jgi:hypothetical protein
MAKKAFNKVEDQVIEAVVEVTGEVFETVVEDIPAVAVENEVPLVEDVPTVAKKSEKFPLEVIEGQLGIYENRVINVPAEAKVIEIENIEGGDMYVDNTGIQYGANYMLTPGQVKVYKGAKQVFLSSASRPIFRIRFFKG